MNVWFLRLKVLTVYGIQRTVYQLYKNKPNISEVEVVKAKLFSVTTDSPTLTPSNFEVTINEIGVIEND